MSENTLNNQVSPYLLQHANHPVHWHSWCDEALSLAKQQNKPILLSIGYSACHWCHVMAHESFSDEETAKIMNEHFINIKVDREERPDLDKIYQTAHQLLTGQAGGWPLTVFLTGTSQIPFFSGTYFPLEARYQLPSFKQLMQQIIDFITHNEQALAKQNQSVLQAIAALNKAPSLLQSLNVAPIDAIRSVLAKQFDARHGGFSNAPKFPSATVIGRLLRHWHQSQQNQEDKQAQHMAFFSLTEMAKGGIFDHVAGGFFRYSVDKQWHIPHFEKMLYDNALLINNYSEAFAISKDPLYAYILDKSILWIIDEMQAPEGGFYTSIDADTEGQEGAFYLWTKEEIATLDIDLGFRKRYGLTNKTNFAQQWHLYLSETPNKTQLTKDKKELYKLHIARQKRNRPNIDDKILTGWNALMIKGLLSAYRYQGNLQALQSAEKALHYLIEICWQDAKLYAVSKNNQPYRLAYSDDYIFLIEALLEYLQITWRQDYFDYAKIMAKQVCEQFGAPQGGLFLTSNQHENLLFRPQSYMDESTPSSNGVFAKLLNRLAILDREKKYQDLAEQTILTTWVDLMAMPSAFSTIIDALDELLMPPEVIIVIAQDRKVRQQWLQLCLSHFHPKRLIFALPAKHIPFAWIAEYKPNIEPVAMICKATECLTPITHIESLRKYIKNDCND